MADEHEQWMHRALALAEQARDLGEVPVGAVVVRDGEVVGRGYNRPIAACDPTAHAELEALRDAARRLGNYRLPGCRLYVTIEPCCMCTGAMIHARIEELVFGASEPRAGAVVSRQRLLDSPLFNHRPAYRQGVLAEPCAALIRTFFRERRHVS